MNNTIYVKYDSNSIDKSSDTFQNKTSLINNINFDALNKVTSGDKFLSYVLMVSCLQIGISRITQNSEIKIGIPSFNNDGVQLLETTIPFVSFKDFLIEMKRTITNHFYSSKQVDEGNHIIVSYEGINKYNGKYFDILFDISINAKELILEITYKDSRYNPSTIDILGSSIEYVIATILENLNTNISDLMKVNRNEFTQVEAFNNLKNSYPVPELCSTVSLFEKAASKYKDKSALIENDNSVTYQKLSHYSNSLANHLEKRGVGQGDIVAILNNRSIYSIVSMLAILKVGAAYAPIDANYPKERVKSFLKNSSINHIITTKPNEYLLDLEEKEKVTFIDIEWDNICACNNSYDYKENMEALCYVIFTSGSTGKPKIAAIKHIGWSNLLMWFSDTYEIKNNDSIYLISSISFDISQRSIFMSLINGSTLHLYSDVIYDADKIRQYIYDNKISILNCAPSTFYPLLMNEEYDLISSLRCLFLGGEAISPQRLAMWYKSEQCNAILSNVYGVAECSDVSSYYELHDFEKYMVSGVPIGYPIYNNKLYITDKDGHYLPIGCIGEICISGVGNGAGYINDPILTADKFMKLADGTEVYKTGDMGRFNGEFIEYKGRMDYQVKIRGNRVELGDIENALRQNTYVKEAAVVINKGTSNLIAYLYKASSASNIPAQELIDSAKECIRAALPAYMHPDKYIVLDEIPLNQNGKIDRLKLSLLDIEEQELQYEEAEGIYKEVSNIVSLVLGKNQIDICKNIFDQGMHSILVIKLVGEINKKYDIKIKPFDIYINSDVKKLADKINDIQNSAK